ncbi:hypothetical protein AB0J35_61070 [Nonomuraea angiospora]|uniref:hypothetical protein n=1 Tax=Nonomuraea angiospora TaxID=46172 RepID=UPI0034399206
MTDYPSLPADLPVPEDDGAATHLPGMKAPHLEFQGTGGATIRLDALAAGAVGVFGLSSQDSDYQREVVERLHLPFQMLADPARSLARALDCWTGSGRPGCYGVENRPGPGGEESSGLTPFVTRRNSSFSASTEPAATV